VRRRTEQRRREMGGAPETAPVLRDPETICAEALKFLDVPNNPPRPAKSTKPPCNSSAKSAVTTNLRRQIKKPSTTRFAKLPPPASVFSTKSAADEKVGGDFPR